MPYDTGDSEGYFFTEGKNPERLNYQVESWVKEGEYPERRHDIEEGDLSSTDFMVLEVWGEDRKDVQFITIWGPLESWSDLELLLAYDFGEDGSLYGAVQGIGTTG